MLSVPDELRIVIQRSSGLPETTQKALTNVVSRFGSDVLDEAERIAAVDHEGSGEALVTPGHIHDADRVKRRAYRQRPAFTKTQKICGIIVIVFSFVAGICIEDLKETWALFGTILSIAIVLVATIAGWTA